MSEDQVDDTYDTVAHRFRTIRIPMPRDAFYRLPANGAYKYEYIEGQTEITPRPHCRDLFLEFDSFRAREWDSYERWRVRPMEEGDWEELPKLAAAAFYRVAPFATFSDDELGEVFEGELGATRKGRDGELLGAACRVAEESVGEGAPLQIVGASLVTLRKGETNGGAMTPALNWIFVSPWRARRGVAGRLLSAVVENLRGGGYTQMESVICTGNHASAMWHWQMGFRMGPSYTEKARRRISETHAGD